MVDQGEVETYLQVYAVLLADRRVALISERTLLALKRNSRKTKAAFRAAHASSESELEIPEGLSIQPEHEVLLKELSDNATTSSSWRRRLDDRLIKL